MATLATGHGPTEIEPGVFDPLPTSVLHTNTHVFYLWDVADGTILKIQRRLDDPKGLNDFCAYLRGAALVRWIADLACGLRHSNHSPMPKFRHGAQCDDSACPCRPADEKIPF